MRWKQFFTPVRSLDAVEARAHLDRNPGGAVTLIDVRQPEEYASGHIPGARLIPLPELGERLSEIDAGKPVLVYCAIGGRSRVAAQMLAGKGFESVINLSGGIKAWNSQTAVGPEDLGLALFSGKESPEQTLAVAYQLEAGLRDFYESMAPRVTDPGARRLFEKLSAIEAKHQERIHQEYARLTGSAPGREAFARQAAPPAVEGGLSTGEYLKRYPADLEALGDIVSLAMSIEAQALDLYQRAAERAESAQGREVLARIAEEERNHLKQLGGLFGTFPGQWVKG